MSQFTTLPKAELHLHLEGAIPPEAILAIARRGGLIDLLPGNDAESVRRWFTFDDFAHFVTVVRTIKSLLRTPDDFATAVTAMGRALAAEQVRYAEVTVTPYTYIGYLNHGVTIDLLLEGLEAGRRQVLAESGVELRWIFDIPRNRSFANYQHGGAYVPGAAERTLEFALQGMDAGVIGLGLGGNEVNAPPEPFAPVFAEAKRHGLKSVPHAGESEGAPSVWGAIEALGADRIGHGIRAVEDAALVALLAERAIPLEINLTSNVYLKFVSDLQAHPLPLLERAGVMVTINTDDPTLIGASLSAEYQLLVDVYGYTPADVIRIARNAFTSSFAEPALKARLLAEFDEKQGLGIGV